MFIEYTLDFQTTNVGCLLNESNSVLLLEIAECQITTFRRSRRFGQAHCICIHQLDIISSYSTTFA